MLDNAQDICMLTGDKLPLNTGGPIHVTRFMENPLAPHKVRVNFVVRHVGTGNFYDRAEGEICDPSITNTNLNKVDVNLIGESYGLQIACDQFSGNSTGTITLSNEAPMTVTCTLTADPYATLQTYAENITIGFRYRYSESINRSIVIQPAG